MRECPGEMSYGGTSWGGGGNVQGANCLDPFNPIKFYVNNYSEIFRN